MKHTMINNSGLYEDINDISEELCNNLEQSKFGTGENYSQFDSEGNLVMHGNARVLRTLQLPASAIKAHGVNAASLVDYGLNGAYEFAKNVVRQVSFAFAIPYDMDRTVSPKIKIGWSTPATDGTVCWDLKYVWRGLGDDVSTDTPDEQIHDHQVVSTPANGYRYSYFTLIAPESTDKIIQAQVIRLGTESHDDADESAYLIGVSFEHTKNTLGL